MNESNKNASNLSRVDELSVRKILVEAIIEK